MVNHEYQLLKERIVEHIVVNDFQTRKMTLISLIDMIHDEKMQETLTEQYLEILPYVTINRISHCLDVAEKYKEHCQRQYNLVLDQMWHNEKMVPSHQQLTSNIMDLIEKCLNNIDTCLEYVYKCQIEQWRMRIRNLQ